MRPRGVRRGGDTTQPLPALLHPHTQLLHARAPLLCTRRPHARASGTTVKIRPICNFSLILKFPFTPRIYFTTQSDCEVSSKVTVQKYTEHTLGTLWSSTLRPGTCMMPGKSARDWTHLSSCDAHGGSRARIEDRSCESSEQLRASQRGSLLWLCDDAACSRPGAASGTGSADPAGAVSPSKRR